MNTDTTKRYSEADVREFAAYYSLLSKYETDFTLFRHFENWQKTKTEEVKEQLPERIIVSHTAEVGKYRNTFYTSQAIPKDKYQLVSNAIEDAINGKEENTDANTFTWTDKNVEEFVKKYFNHVDVPFQGIYLRNYFADFKQSKQLLSQYTPVAEPLPTKQDKDWDGNVHWLFEKLKSMLLKENKFEFAAAVRQVELNYKGEKSDSTEVKEKPSGWWVDLDNLSAVSLLKYNTTTPSKPIEEDKPKGCGICGGKMVMIRGRYPKEPEREVCPTCATERLEQINDISSKDYSKTYQSL